MIEKLRTIKKAYIEDEKQLKNKLLNLIIRLLLIKTFLVKPTLANWTPQPFFTIFVLAVTFWTLIIILTAFLMATNNSILVSIPLDVKWFLIISNLIEVDIGVTVWVDSSF